MKILHLVSSGGLFGAERVIINLARCTVGSTCFVGAVHNVHNPHLEVIEEAKKSGLHTVVFNSKGQFDPRTVITIRKFLRDYGIDIIHTHNYKSDILGFWASRFSRSKWVGTNHVWHSTDTKLKFYESLDAFFLQFADMVTAVSQEIKDDLLRKGFNDQKVVVIDNGIDIAKFKINQDAGSLKRTLFNFKESDIVVVIAGRLAKEKAHDIFLTAAKKVLETHRNIRFLIIGDGPLRQTLEQLSRQLEISENVLFAGIRTDMPQIYCMADLMVNASYIEGLPMTILEAMAAKLPVICTRVGAVPNVIENQRNGVCIEPGDSEKLADAIIELIDHDQKRRQFAESAFKDVCERFSDVSMAHKYLRIYQSLVVPEKGKS